MVASWVSTVIIELWNYTGILFKYVHVPGKFAVIECINVIKEQYNYM